MSKEAEFDDPEAFPEELQVPGLSRRERRLRRIQDHLATQEYRNSIKEDRRSRGFK